MAQFGDTSQYSALMAHMLANARNRPIAPTGHKVLALGGTPVSSNLSNTQNQTAVGIDAGAILSLFGQHPAQKAAKDTQLHKDAEMAWIAYNTNLTPDQRDKLYSNPQMQGMLSKMKDVGSPYVWNNPDSGRLEMIPMSPDMIAKVAGIKAPTADQIMALPAGHPVRENWIDAKNQTRQRSEAELAGPNLVQQKYNTAAGLNIARTGEAQAGAGLKGAQTAITPQLGQLREAQAGLAKAETGYVEGQKGQPAKIKQQEDEATRKTINSTMTNFHKSFTDATKVDYRYGTEEYAQQLTNLNSATVGTLNQLKQYDAKPEMAGVVGSWMTRVNKELATPPKMSGGKISPNEEARLNDIKNSIKQVVQTVGLDIPDYQKQAITEMINKLNIYTGTAVPGGTQ